MKTPARTRLLETATELFLQRGHSEVGVNEIISQSKTTKATFYKHFPSKDLLVEAWLKRVHQHAADRQKAILESERCPKKKLADCFDDLANYMVKTNYRGCPYSNSCVVTDLSCYGIRHQIEHHKEESRLFYRLLAKEITRENDGNDVAAAKQLGDRIFILYSGATTEAQNLRELWPVETAKATALELCRHA